MKWSVSMVDKSSFIIKCMFSRFLTLQMWLNSHCTLEAMFRFPVLGHLRRVERYAEKWKKDDFASILSAWFYFVFAKKIKILVPKCVIYVSSVKYIKSTHIN